MSVKPIISIIVPIYNYGHTLPRCINSILNQNCNSYEIILVDDGSTDNTSEVCQTFYQKHSQYIIHLSQENKGPSSARNYGVQYARGNYITFLDADDAMAVDALSKIKACINQKDSAYNEPNIILGRHQSVDINGKVRLQPIQPTYKNREKNFYAYLLGKDLAISNGAIYFHRDILTKIQFPENIKGGEDIPVFALALAMYPCIAINSILVVVYKHSDSLRYKTPLTVDNTMAIVPCVFDSPHMPDELQHYKCHFQSMRLLSLFRALYKNRRYNEARKIYLQAIKIQPTNVFRLAYFRKFIKALLN